MHRQLIHTAIITMLASAGAAVSLAQDADELLSQAARAAQRGEHAAAIRQLSDVIDKSPKTTIAWYLRGREHFRAGQIAESVTDFDKYVELRPEEANRQWERGISYYYAG